MGHIHEQTDKIRKEVKTTKESNANVKNTWGEFRSFMENGIKRLKKKVC